MAGKCSECEKPAVAHGLCSTHYAKQRRGGDVSAPVRQRRTEGVNPVSSKVSDDCLSQLQAEADATSSSVYAVIATVLEKWAARRKRQT